MGNNILHVKSKTLVFDTWRFINLYYCLLLSLYPFRLLGSCPVDLNIDSSFHETSSKRTTTSPETLEFHKAYLAWIWGHNFDRENLGTFSLRSWRAVVICLTPYPSCLFSGQAWGKFEALWCWAEKKRSLGDEVMVKRWAIFSEKMGISVERKSGFGQWGLRESSKLGSCFRAICSL